MLWLLASRFRLFPVTRIMLSYFLIHAVITNLFLFDMLGPYFEGTKMEKLN